MSVFPCDSKLSPGATPLWGTVVAVQANFYQVQLEPGLKVGTLKVEGLEDDVQSEHPQPKTDIQPSNIQPVTLLCTRRTRLKKIGQRVMVGDRVVVEEPDWEGQRGAIAEVLPRKTQLDRPPVANADEILLVFALADPPLDPYQLTRFLVKAESTELGICLCLNKKDLVSDEQLEEWTCRLRNWGYQPVLISVHTHQGLEELSKQLNHKITIFAGPSGVGKSSLINQLIPDVNVRVAAVSGKLSRGRHTTRHVELFDLPTGGLLADTPGFNQPDIDCPPEELAQYFPEARHRLATGRCQFSDCLHRDEPNCAVRGDWERYEYYLDLLEDAIAWQERLHQQADPESSMKAKTKGKGQTHYEPKLESKKYRRRSRRSQHQALEDVYQDSEE
ncbi:small ribosomal subunit biogenesis GTPase RsgA [Microcoleus sp. FACHB-53]|nr:small ribosomal subunit biogenesis GTPase RsgA [Microcoleus sp. FACHB-53]